MDDSIINRFRILTWTKVIKNTMIRRKLGELGLLNFYCWDPVRWAPKKNFNCNCDETKRKKKKNDVKKGYNMCHAHVFPSKWFCQQSHVNASATPRPTIDSLRFPFIRSLKKKKKNNNKTSFFQPKHTRSQKLSYFRFETKNLCYTRTKIEI